MFVTYYIVLSFSLVIQLFILLEFVNLEQLSKGFFTSTPNCLFYKLVQMGSTNHEARLQVNCFSNRMLLVDHRQYWNTYRGHQVFPCKLYPMYLNNLPLRAYHINYSLFDKLITHSCPICYFYFVICVLLPFVSDQSLWACNHIVDNLVVRI